MRGRARRAADAGPAGERAASSPASTGASAYYDAQDPQRYVKALRRRGRLRLVRDLAVFLVERLTAAAAERPCRSYSRAGRDIRNLAFSGGYPAMPVMGRGGRCSEH
ncbi:MAG: hypothetical protein R3D03_13435 [Geminicoccaceae bacterium]